MSLDVLKLYCGEDIVRQNPDRYTDDGELTELQEIPLGELERVYMEPVIEGVNPEIPIETYLEIGLQVTEDFVDREGIHE